MSLGWEALLDELIWVVNWEDYVDGGESIWTVFEIGCDNEYDDEYYDDGAFVFDRNQEYEIALETAIEEGEPLIIWGFCHRPSQP